MVSPREKIIEISSHQLAECGGVYLSSQLHRREAEGGRIAV
jgi:hypothetical protein